MHILANDSKHLCSKGWFFLVLSSHLNFRKSGWVLDFSTCPGLYGVKCNASHFRWPAEKTERRDELVSASCLFPFLPTAIVLNLEKKKVYRKRNCSCSGDKNCICCLASQSKRQLGEIIPIVSLTLFCELVTFLSNYLCYLIQSYHHSTLIISVAPVCTDL